MDTACSGRCIYQGCALYTMDFGYALMNEELVSVAEFH